MGKLTVKIFNLKGSTKNRFFACSIMLLLLTATLVLIMFGKQIASDRRNAELSGQSIITLVQAELRRCVTTTSVIKNLFDVDEVTFLDNFSSICDALMRNDLVVGSMYWAPDARIKYSYPYFLKESTDNFNMLEDPIQGPKAQLAIDRKSATVAGPHALIEGGVGIIIRNPYFDDKGNFKAFAIMVIDKVAFLQGISNAMKIEDKNYRFSIWKTDDPTALTDEYGYILSSGEPIKERTITIPFQAPNDTWQIAVEPIGGWQYLNHSLPIIIVIIITMLVAEIILFLIFRGYQMALEMDKLAEDKNHIREIEAANDAKTAFLFNMSHDIRTPMNAIIGFRNLLEKYQDDPVHRADYLLKIKKSSEVLLSIINNVLEMARIEKGAVQIDEKPWNVQTFTDMLTSLFGDMMAQKSITFSVETDVTNKFVYVDIVKLREIIYNIMSNAYKYTNEGGKVSMRITELPCSAKGYTIFKTEISDTGIGMSEKYLPHIFDEFSREHSSTDNKIEGTGLGMPIVKRLVELMGGTIDVQSIKGKGTTFTVILKHKIADEGFMVETASKSEKDLSAFEGKRLLIAEDNDLNAEIAIDILNELGLTVDRAEDGKKAVEMVLSHPAGYYDAILMDIQMPVMDGYEATAFIRTMSDNAKANIPVLAMTANVFEEDKRNALRAGMNGHIAKPIEVNELIKMLNKYIG